jgi:3-isopropylmalate/(R)-2-methylmalate dehydratase small subunit
MAEGFPRIAGVAAPLLQDNIDTDTIAPGSRTVKGESTKAEFKEKGSSELARDLFANWRYDEEGREISAFVLNQPGFRDATILIAGENFGCGSSRESAVWMLKEFGIRCVIAPSFGEIFWGNCFKNSVLPVTLPGDQIRALAEEAQPQSAFIVDLARNEIAAPSGKVVRFDLPEFRRRGLLDGLDEIDVTLEMEPQIADFLDRAAEVSPWAYRLPK